MSFPENIWYMAMWSADLGASPVAKRITDRPLVFYRTEDGKATALADACPHRFVPLHLGEVVGDRIRCAYHGLEFGPNGVCAHNPHGKGRIPPAAKTKSYPTLERNTIIWVWIGDGEPDESLIPNLDMLEEADPALVSKRDFIRMEASYMLVTENLLDLSHASFLHMDLLGNEETVKADLKLESTEKGFIVHRFTGDVRIPQFPDLMFHRDGRRVDMWTDISWQAPGCLINDNGVTDVGAPRSEGTGTLGIHLLTPETAGSTLYYFVSIRRNPLPVPESEMHHIRDKISEMRRFAFGQQDQPVLEAQRKTMSDPAVDISRPALFEIDLGAAEFHRRLKKLMDVER